MKRPLFKFINEQKFSRWNNIFSGFKLKENNFIFKQWLILEENYLNIILLLSY